MKKYALALMILTTLGCSGTTTEAPRADAGADAAADATDQDAGNGGDAADAGGITWTAVYGAYFGPGTPGHCGNSGCHATARAGFACGTTKDSCYNGLVAASLVTTTSPATSRLISAASPLAWFGGNMPVDNPSTNAKAAADTKAWVLAGAQNN